MDTALELFGACYFVAFCDAFSFTFEDSSMVAGYHMNFSAHWLRWDMGYIGVIRRRCSMLDTDLLYWLFTIWYLYLLK